MSQPRSNQGSFEWYRDRFAKITSSDRIKTLMNGHVHELNKLLDTIRKAQAATDDEIRHEWERSMSISEYVEALAWGKRLEHESIQQYELSRGLKVTQPGFVTHPLYPLIGDSTDFIEHEDGKPAIAGEIKCPFDSANHLIALRHGMPAIYYHQCQAHIEVHNLDRGKFVSYDPRHKIIEDRIFVQLLTRDIEWQAKFHLRASEFHYHMTHGSRFEHKIGGVKDGIPGMF